MIVEDHEDTRDLLDQALRALGATVSAVATARDALARLPGVDLILTDVALPGDDGVWLCDQASRQSRPVPVIALSGFIEAQYPRMATARFARTLLKPVAPDDVAHVILDVLGRTGA